MATPDEYAVLTAVCTTIESEIPELHGYPFPVANMVTPFFIPSLTANYDDDWKGGIGPWKGQLIIFCKIGTGQSGGRDMLEFTSPIGTKSVHQALITNQTLGGVALNVRSTGPTDDLRIVTDSEGNPLYWSRTMGIEIYVNRSLT